MKKEDRRTIKWLEDKFYNKRSYFKVGSGKIASVFDVSPELVIIAKEQARDRILFNEAEVSGSNSNKRNVLFIPDLHLPFAEEEALAFCQRVYEEEGCNEVVFGGDIIDNHYSSFHNTDPEGLSAADELNAVQEQLNEWVSAFPEAIVLIGNHDRVPQRHAFNVGLASSWIKTLPEMFDLPWEFKEYHTIGDWYIVHGEGMQAVARAGSLGMSVIQFHYHSKLSAQLVDAQNNRWAIQGGCLVDHNSYAMAYAKQGPPMAKGCVVIKDIEGESQVVIRTFNG